MEFFSKTSQTLLSCLERRYPESSKRTIKNWITHKRVLVHSKPITVSTTIVTPKDPIVVLPKTTKTPHEGVEILYSCSQYLIVKKPANLLSVPLDTKEETNLLTILQREYPQKIYPVHRLDREVSGLLLFAKGKQNQLIFKKYFEKREIQRHYIALVQGHVQEDMGKWEFPLKELPNTYVVAAEDGKEAITFYKVLERRKNTTVLLISLATGRKHQIRVHSAMSGHPVLGDNRYNDVFHKIGRIALHAYKLQFYDPFEKKNKSFFSPPSAMFSIDLRLLSSVKNIE